MSFPFLRCCVSFPFISLPMDNKAFSHKPSQATAMAVASTSNSSSLRTNLKPQICLSNPALPSHLFLRQIYGHPARPKPPNSSGFSIRAYMEESNSLAGFASKVVGSLPVFGLIARILSDEGGVGGDVIDFAEFRRRVGKNCSVMDSKAFYEFQDRRGRAGDPLYVLLCCWLAGVGAGLLKSEEILEGVARLRISNDIEFEEENFLALMNEAREKRAKLKISAPKIPMEIRVEKAVEAIYICCFGKDAIEEDDETLLSTMLKAVFPSVEQTALQKIIKDKAIKVAEGGDEDGVSIPQPLSKEAVQLQMKDLQFLQQQSDV